MPRPLLSRWKVQLSQLVEFAGNHPLLVLFIMAMGFAVLFYEYRMKSQGITNISVPQAVQLMNRGAVVVDVRAPAEYAAGHLVSSKNIPLDTLEADQSKDKFRKKNVLVVCDSGMSSGRAANLLRTAGFENVFSVRGGIRAWREDNLPLVK